MKKSSPMIKGVLTGIVMTALVLIFVAYNLPADSGLQFVVFAVYAAGIVWTLLSFSKSAGYTGKFVDLFGQGFRCFIIVTLILTVFTGVYSMMHPELAEDQAKSYREYLVSKKDKTPREVDDMVADGKKHYTTGLIYSSVIRYLFIGAAFTAASAGAILILRRRI
ncbi:MAG: DUF4199 family protein [Chitinophagaceae bacterium]